MTRVARTLFAALVFAALTALASLAAAQPTDDASAHFDRGVSFFKDGDYTAAMVEFKRAYEIDPNFRVLYNLGQTSRELRDYAAALTSFERYLEEGGAKIEPDRKKKVEAWVNELRGKVATVTLKTNVEGVEVSVDDVAIGTTPLGKPIVMNAGRRRVTLMKAGYAPRTQYVDVAGTEVKTVSLDVVALTAPPASSAAGAPDQGRAAPPAGSAKPGGSIAPWVMLGVTGAAAIAAGVVGAVSLQKKAAFDDALTTYPTTSATVDGARSSARTFAVTADVLTGVAIASGVATIVLFVVDRSGHREQGALRRPLSVAF